MGFNNKWISWMNACLQSATISILVNGSPTLEFSLEKGVRQGDLLSPYLFLIATEGLNRLAKKASDVNLLKGIDVGTNRIKVSYLQYADDTLFLGEWSKKNERNIMKLLMFFEKLSGLKVNFTKSSLFGVGVPNHRICEMTDSMGCDTGSFPFTYLGLPLGCNMNKVKD
ncbi:uncharacterized mitochondrial protein AtMg01250-like [Rutidosis leptorrhynchoides]|uniref:uncharacterized mitochondrial protein AtMg01250-like n=1 Tax=Rutidosis leptorrhynchoides TaxID=125765 RepID=UPI003A999712